MNNESFKPIHGKPQWLFNQRAKCAVKVNEQGHTTDTVRTDKYNSVMEAIELYERACACTTCIEGEA